jgi:hypothetical protein
MENDTDKLLKSVIETLIKKEAPKFKSLIQKELASRIHDKIEELKKALSGQIVTGVGEKGEAPQPLPENLPGAPSAPPVTTPMKAGDLKIVPTAAGSAKDDISLDPNFEKEFYHSSQKYKGQDVLIKQLGTGFGKPVRVYRKSLLLSMRVSQMKLPMPISRRRNLRQESPLIQRKPRNHHLVESNRGTHV